MPRWAHPRGCGADSSPSSTNSSSRGSSPRVRGRQAGGAGCGGSHGLIPAGAGQTWLPRRHPALWRAHPRGCGADGFDSVTTRCVMGSSPRVRGRLEYPNGIGDKHGLIPAGAGQTSVSRATSPARRAHPRGCGADGHVVLGEHALDGLIPAGAGQTPTQTAFLSKRWAHPRGCGADLLPHLYAGRAGGLIPAGAGQTCSVHSPATQTRAHPRGCGADPSTSYIRPTSPGSSPRVRGRRRRVFLNGGVMGLIPAGAGQTGHVIEQRGKLRAHPRGCGADL